MACQPDLGSITVNNSLPKSDLFDLSINLAFRAPTITLPIFLDIPDVPIGLAPYTTMRLVEIRPALQSHLIGKKGILVSAQLVA